MTEDGAKVERKVEDLQTPRWVDSVARFLLGIFFRKVEVTGAGSVPQDRPLVFVANHINALVDPALLMAYLPVKPRFLAKSTLWKNPMVRPFLELAAAIPVYRRQDPGVDTNKNAETFARCHEVLAGGGAIAIFPEGRSHNEPSLVPLKTGVSRIVLQADHRFGGLETRIVPVGLTFDDKGRFRSRVLMAVGEAIDPAPEAKLFPTEPIAAVRGLTERVREALRAVTLNYPSWEEARLIERAAEIYERPSAELPSQRNLADGFSVRKAFIQGYGALSRRFPERVGAVARAVRAYDELLEHYRLRDAQVASRYPAGPVASFAVRTLSLLLVRLPLAAVGTVLHFLPFQLVRVLAEKLGKTPDVLATYKVFASFLAYPLTWLAAAAAVGWRWGLWAGIAMALLAPLTAVEALRFHERKGHFLRQLRAYLLLRSGTRPVSELRRLRSGVLEEVRKLAELYLEGPEGQGTLSGETPPS